VAVEVASLSTEAARGGREGEAGNAILHGGKGRRRRQIEEEWDEFSSYGNTNACRWAPLGVIKCMNWLVSST